MKGLKIGITGGIGSGKSIVTKVFKIIGVPIYDADFMAKDLMVSNQQIIEALKSTFGDEVYRADGTLDRKILAEIVFNDEVQLKRLNAIVHPVVIAHAEQWADSQTARYSVKEAALLFESDSYKNLDAVILVTAPEKIRISRVMKRDDVSENEVKARMSKQWGDEQKLPLADFVIHNDDSRSIIEQVLDIDKILKEKH